ncbi:MAG TPA: heavy metal translocating P-type ATPase [Polyangiaceae bacterium]
MSAAVPAGAGPLSAKSPSASSYVACTHCSLPVPAARQLPDSGSQFCCDGCRAVHLLITEGGLDDYYAYRDRAEPEPRPAQTTARSYADFDDPAFRALYCRSAPEDLSITELFLEGVHCAACVWLVERLPRLLPGVAEARLDLTRQVVHVAWDDREISLSRVARTLDSLGYPAHALGGQRSARARREQQRTLLLRIAVAGAAAGNAMLMAFALYGGMFAGMERQYSELFRFGSLALALPSVAWSAALFYRGAWAALRTRTPHMDLPVTIGILTGFAWGAWNTWRGVGEVYFDTITVLIFLLLIGRFIQNKQQESARDAAELLHSLAPAVARLVEESGVREVPSASLAVDQLIEVRAGEHVPADGRVVSGASRLDCAWLTGETRPEFAEPDSLVHAGTVNLTAALRVRVVKSGADTRVGQLMKRVEEAALRRAPIVKLADRIAGSFVVAALALAAVTVCIWLFIDPARAVDNAVALLVVTCPCALGMATPLAVSVALGRAARRGILVKGGDALEQLAGRGLFVFDKTGTLTQGELRLVSWLGDASLRPLTRAAEAHSGHPIAAAFVRDLAGEPEARVESVESTLGGGIACHVEGRQLVIGSESYVRARATVPAWVDAAIREQALAGWTPVLIASDGEARALASFGDPLRPDAVRSLRRLTELGYEVAILSGDHPAVVTAVAEQLDVSLQFARGGVTPEEKLATVERLRQSQRVFMVGDGINDAAALSAAHVGIAVHGGAEASLAAADAFLRQSGVTPIVELVLGARRTLHVIRRGLAFSLIYNGLGVGLALAGVLNPVLAAILMPLSSLTVITSSFRSKTFESVRSSQRQSVVDAGSVRQSLVLLPGSPS